MNKKKENKMKEGLEAETNRTEFRTLTLYNKMYETGLHNEVTPKSQRKKR